MYLNRSGRHLNEGHKIEYKIHKSRGALLPFSALELKTFQAKRFLGGHHAVLKENRIRRNVIWCPVPAPTLWAIPTP